MIGHLLSDPDYGRCLLRPFLRENIPHIVILFEHAKHDNIADTCNSLTAIMACLFCGMGAQLRREPYLMIQCDRVTTTIHFRSDYLYPDP